MTEEQVVENQEEEKVPQESEAENKVEATDGDESSTKAPEEPENPENTVAVAEEEGVFKALWDVKDEEIEEQRSYKEFDDADNFSVKPRTSEYRITDQSGKEQIVKADSAHDAVEQSGVKDPVSIEFIENEVTTFIEKDRLEAQEKKVAAPAEDKPESQEKEETLPAEEKEEPQAEPAAE